MSPHREHDFRDRLEDAAIEAELETGRREPTRDAAKSHVFVRLGRITLSVLIIILGIVLMPLPGPGWLIVAGGFTLLAKDVAWANRVVALIRKKVPGIPEDGKIPRSSIVTMVVFTAAMTFIGIFFGGQIKDALFDAWGWFVGLF